MKNMWKKHLRMNARVLLHAISEKREVNTMAANMYELLYMIRMKNAEALEEMFCEYKRCIDAEVAGQISRHGILRSFRDDLMIEGQIGIVRAAECYRQDQPCKFSSFVNVVIHRRIQQAAKHFRLLAAEHGLNPLSLDLCDTDMSAPYTNLLPAKDWMGNPEYRLHYNEAQRRMDAAVRKMNDTERKILHSWTEGGSYVMKAEKMGMTYRQYEGKLGRVKRKVFSAVREEGI